MPEPAPREESGERQSALGDTSEALPTLCRAAMASVINRTDRRLLICLHAVVSEGELISYATVTSDWGGFC